MFKFLEAHSFIRLASEGWGHLDDRWAELLEAAGLLSETVFSPSGAVVSWISLAGAGATCPPLHTRTKVRPSHLPRPAEPGPGHLASGAEGQPDILGVMLVGLLTACMDGCTQRSQHFQKY